MSGRRLAIAASGLVLSAAVAGLWTNGSPWEHRERRIDARRAEDLLAMETAVHAFHRREGRLPASVEAFADQVSGNTRDPEHGAPYEYRALDDRRFELCARFSLPGTGRRPGQYGGEGPWRHPAGRHCFERKVAPAGGGAG